MAEANYTLILRVCTRCREALPANLDHFPPHKMCKHGLFPRCRPCKRSDDAARRARPDQLVRQKAWRDSNKDRVRQANLEYRAAGYKSTAAVAKWRSENLEAARERARDFQRSRRENDIGYRLLCRLRARLSTMVKGRAGRRTEEILGYTMADLRAHLDRQFTKGMTWNLVKSGAIQIDHIVPVAAFKITSLDCPDFKACWSLANLQPLWKADNLKKNAKRLTLL